MSKAAPTGLDRLELMQTFVRIVEAGSLSAAARQMASTQPTISRRLMWLEQTLGLKLLQRSTHAMKLTEDGERCYAHAKTLLEAWSAVESDLRGAKDTPRGHLRAIAPHAFGQHLLVEPLAEFLRENPEVTVDWMLLDRQVDFIAEGIDCAIRVGAVEEPGVVAVRLGEVPRILVAAPGLWGAGDPPSRPEELARLPWLALTQFYRNEIKLRQVDGARIETLAIQPRMCTDNLYAARSGVRSGIGAALVSAWLVADDLASGQLCQLAPDWEASPLPVHLIYPYARIYPARLREFIAVMKRATPNIPGMRPPTPSMTSTLM
ncbi:MAG: LysR family transcriptional regulator [Burkholderiaceae bacterium]|nr:LysR family transcriptional regulator [Burkholderiaceae bacterium]